MSKLIEQLQPFILMEAYEKVSAYEETVFELFNKKTDEEIGTYTINSNGELINLSLYDDPKTGNLGKKQIQSIAERFVHTFHPEKLIKYELSAILDLDDFYMVEFEKREEKYGLFLHSSGFSVSVSTAGQIKHFYYNDEEFEVKYSDIVVSKEDALKQYLAKLDFELAIIQMDKEIYINGDNQYHLAYSVIDYIVDIPVDGSDTISTMETNDSISEIPFQQIPTKDIYELIGLSSQYKLLDVRRSDGKRTEIWSKRESIGVNSFDMDESENHIIKICFDEKTGMLLRIISGEEQEEAEEELKIDDARQYALDLMFKLFPDTHQRFKIEVLAEDQDDDEDFEEEMVEDDDFTYPTDDEFDGQLDVDAELEEEDLFYIEPEPSFTFYFHLHHNGVRVDQHVSVIEVGRFSGKITHFVIDIPSLNQYENLPTKPVLSFDEAKEIYQKYLEIQRTFVREYDENGKSIYSLSYVPVFPQTLGHVRVIEAITGEAMYVEVGDATFID